MSNQPPSLLLASFADRREPAYGAMRAGVPATFARKRGWSASWSFSKGASILDLAPVILHALGVAVPQALDGRVLAEAFEATSPLAQPVVLSQQEIYKDGVPVPPLSDEEMEEMQDKLRGWGYAG